MKHTACAWWVLFLAIAAHGEELSFQAKPTIKQLGDGYKIHFTLSQATDVDVAIVDAKGTVVRHLAAGVLGGKVDPPPPLLPGLVQNIAWDGRDDRGERLGEGSHSVRVRAGSTPKLGKILANPAQINPSPQYNKLYGLATDDAGELYVASGSVYSNTPVYSIKVFNREGKYLRTIMPMPSSLTADEAAEFGDVKLRGGRLNPGNFDALSPYVQPGGIVAFLGSRVRDNTLWILNTEGRICRLRASDGAPLAWKSGPQSYKPSGGPMCWSVSPDGKSLLLSGYWNAQATQSKGKIPFDDGVLLRIDAKTGRGEPLLKIDVPADSFWLAEENGWYHFTNWGRKNGNAALHGVDVDRDGRLLVCDRVNQRLAVYDQGGKFIGKTDVQWPDHVTLAPDGSVYVSTRKVLKGYESVNEFQVLKLSAAIDGKVEAEITFTGTNAPLLAVDTSAMPAVLWLSNVGDKGDQLVRIEDRGEKFVVAGGLQTGDAFGSVVKVFVDPQRDDVYVNDGWNALARYDGLSGAGGPIPIKAMDMAFDEAGRLYLYGRAGWNEPIYRCDRDFNAVPFAATGKPETELTLATDDEGKRRPIYGRYGTGWSNKGIDIGPDERIYVRCMYNWTKYFVTVFKPDGTAERHERVQGGILGPLGSASGGICVARDGSFYLGADGQPAGAAENPRFGSTVIKVKPTGGGIAELPAAVDDKPPVVDPTRGIAFADYLFEGAVTAYPRMSPQQAGGGCVCKEARFDVDDFGRVYVPDVLNFTIHVYDNAGNLIGDIGHYGNCDDNGDAGPPIPLGWPMGCAVNRAGRLYVADVLNQRIVRVDLESSLEEKISVP